MTPRLSSGRTRKIKRMLLLHEEMPPRACWGARAQLRLWGWSRLGSCPPSSLWLTGRSAHQGATVLGGSEGACLIRLTAAPGAGLRLAHGTPLTQSDTCLAGPSVSTTPLWLFL